MGRRIDEANVRSYSGASHQGAMERLWFHCQGSLTSPKVWLQNISILHYMLRICRVTTLYRLKPAIDLQFHCVMLATPPNAPPIQFSPTMTDVLPLLDLSWPCLSSARAVSFSDYFCVLFCILLLHMCLYVQAVFGRVCGCPHTSDVLHLVPLLALDNVPYV